jgi:hypothetical protein
MESRPPKTPVNPTPVTFIKTVVKSENGSSIRIEVVQPSLDPQKITIDPRGDVTLVLASADGGSGKPHYELEVSSNVLSLASPVFSAMFSSRYREGSSIRENTAAGNTTRISLPDDDPEAMIHLCRLLHHKSNPNELLELKVLGEVAILCHKYDCTSTAIIQRSVEFWLQPKYMDLSDMANLKKALLVTYIFDNPDAFRSVASTYVMNASGTVAESPIDTGYDIELPQHFYSENPQRYVYIMPDLGLTNPLALAAIRRTAVNQKLLGAIYDTFIQLGSDECEDYCSDEFDRVRSRACRTAMTRLYLNKLHDLDLRDTFRLKPHWKPLCEIVVLLKKFRMPDHEGKCDQEECPCYGVDVNEIIATAVKEAKTISRDICLGCVKNEGVKEGCPVCGG